MIRSAGFLLSLSLAYYAVAAETPNNDQEQMIRQSAKKYSEAYSRGDVDALVAMYAPDAEYDDSNGEIIHGRDAIRKKLEEYFKQSFGTKMSIDIKNIKLIRSRAFETGVAKLTPKEGEPIEVPYRAIHAKQKDGKWLMTSVGPDVGAGDAGSAGPLEPLAWMIGTWKDQEEGVDLTSVCSWTSNHRFILRAFAIKNDDGDELKVSEVIGWDPADHVLRSWVFDTDGAFSQNTWSKRGGDWIILAKGILADGGRASAVNVIHPVDANTFTWSSTNRDVDGEMLPDVEDIKMVRVSDTGEAQDGGQK